MKILQINKLYHPVIGGIETIVRQTAEGINNKDDFTVDVLVCNDKFRTTKDHINGVSITRASSLGVFFSMPMSISFIVLLKKMWKRYDVLHLHLPFPLGELALWLIKPKCSIVVTYHSDIIRQRVLSSSIKWLHNWVLNRTERIAVSNPNIIETSPFLRKFRSKCTVIPFGVDTQKFNPDGGILSNIQEIQKRFGKRIILFVGRLVYYKGVEYLIQSMKDVDANLVIIGDGPLKKEMIDKANKEGLGKKIAFIPYLSQDELVNFYRAASIFVLPSIYRSEAFGITIIEAMACGLPVISTELGTGTSYANQNNITGYIVLPRDSEAMNTALKKMLSNNTLLSRMGKAAFERIRTSFTIDKMLNGYKELYKNTHYE